MSDFADMYTALAAAQGEMTDPVKNQKGYGYMYADLAGVLQIARPVLSRHGLSIMQCIGECTDKTVSVLTTLHHSSGKHLQLMSTMPVGDHKGMSIEQSVGSAITYLRRYALCALLGIASDDDTDAAPPKPPVPKQTDRGQPKPKFDVDYHDEKIPINQRIWASAERAFGEEMFHGVGRETQRLGYSGKANDLPEGAKRELLKALIVLADERS